MKRIWLALYGLSLTWFTFGQTNYATVASGNWDDPSIWSPIPTSGHPNSIDGIITINSSHSVTIPAGVALTVDQATINGTLIIAPSAQFTLAHGLGTDLELGEGAGIVVQGNFIRADLSSITQTADASISFQSGASYDHLYTTTPGDLMDALWDTNSTITITGYTSSTIDFISSNWSKALGNVVYNCPGQTGTVNFNGLVNSIRGNLTIQSTGTGLLQLSDSEAPLIDISKNVVIMDGRVNLTTTGVGATITIGGDFTFNSTNSTGSNFVTTGTCIIDVNGNFSMTTGVNGKLFVAGNGGASTLNLKKSFSLLSGTISLSSTSNGSNTTLRFVGNGKFNFIKTGAITATHTINYYIAPTDTLDIGSNEFTGAGSFTLEGSVIVGSTHALGAIQNNTTAGNIRTSTSLRTFTAGSSIIYKSTSPLFIGSGQPASEGVTTVIDNPLGVTLATTVTIGGNLFLKNGILSLSSNRTLNLNGTISYGAGSLAGNLNTSSTTTSALVIGGTSGGNFGTLPFDFSNNIFGTVTLNRAGANASVTLGNLVRIKTAFKLVNGNFDNSVNQLFLEKGATLTREPFAQLLGNRVKNNPGETFNVLYDNTSLVTPFSFSSGLELPDQLEKDDLFDFTLSLNGSGQIYDTLKLTQDITVHGTMSISNGRLYEDFHTITMQGLSWKDTRGTYAFGGGVVIFNDSTVISGSNGNPTFGNFLVKAGKVVTLARSISVSGNLTFEFGSRFYYTAANGTYYSVVMNGKTDQTISANGISFGNITVNKTTPGQKVVLTSPLVLRRVLQFTNNQNVDFQSNGFLTLRSTSDSSAVQNGMIYRLIGNSVSGDISVERYMSGEGRIYRYLSSPVQNATIESWKDDFPITGLFNDPSTAAVWGNSMCGYPFKPTSTSVYYYNEAGNVNSGYVSYPLKDKYSYESPLEVGRGYSVFMRQCSTPTIVDVTGVINQGPISLPVTYTNTGSADDGWNLVGNPYPCAIDWDILGTTGWIKTNIASTIAIRDNGNNGMMRYWDGDGTPRDIRNGVIAPGQAFWVRTTDANPALTIREGSKTSTVAYLDSSVFYRKPNVSSLQISLTRGTLTDKTYLKIRSTAKSGLDQWDAPKLNNELFDLYTFSSDSIPMAINAIKSIDCSSPIMLGIRDLIQGAYTLVISAVTGRFESYSFVLLDHYTDQSCPFTGNYEFKVDENPLSFKEDRFTIMINSKIAASPLHVNYQDVLCETKNTEVTLDSTVSGVQYQFLQENNILTSMEGNGSSLSFKVPVDRLQKGINKFRVKSLSVCNLVLDEREIKISVKELPSGFAVKDSMHCNEGPVRLSVAGVPEHYLVHWYSAQESNEIIFTGPEYETPTLLKTSTYYVVVVDTFQCFSDRIAAKAEIIYVENPVIELESNDFLQTNYSEHVQWYLNGLPLEGENDPTLKVIESGTYSVKVLSQGCEVQSDFEYSVTGIENKDQFFTIYPNPVTDKLVIHTLSSERIQEVFLMNSEGIKARLTPVGSDNSHTLFDTTSIAAGLYLVEIRSSRTNRVFKIIKVSTTH